MTDPFAFLEPVFAVLSVAIKVGTAILALIVLRSLWKAGDQ